MDKVKFSKTKSHQRYKTQDGENVPGVTTALGVINKPALLAWAWQCGVDGIDFRKSRDQAADIGTLAHWLCECYLKGVAPDTSEFSKADIDKAENAFVKFLSWWDSMGLTLVESECQLVSERYKFGGTLDIMAKDKAGKLFLCDIKTSKGIYPEMFYQLAAYATLWSENRSEPISGVYIIRIGKQAEDGDFEVQSRNDLARHWAVFLAALDLYNKIKDAK
jgi:hypothetical protein